MASGHGPDENEMLKGNMLQVEYSFIIYVESQQPLSLSLNRLRRDQVWMVFCAGLAKKTHQIIAEKTKSERKKSHARIIVITMRIIIIITACGSIRRRERRSTSSARVGVGGAGLRSLSAPSIRPFGVIPIESISICSAIPQPNSTIPRYSGEHIKLNTIFRLQISRCRRYH